MALPLPGLSWTGGAGGSATSGDATSSSATPLGTAFGAFNVGGSGTRQGGASASAAADATSTKAPDWLWPVLIVIASILLAAALYLRKR